MNVARFFGTRGPTGTVAEGKEAGLILLDAGPLGDVANAGRISSVAVRGVVTKDGHQQEAGSADPDVGANIHLGVYLASSRLAC